MGGTGGAGGQGGGGAGGISAGIVWKGTAPKFGGMTYMTSQPSVAGIAVPTTGAGGGTPGGASGAADAIYESN